MNVPKLRFKEFTNEYKKVKFGDIVNYQKGFAFRSGDYKNNGIRVIRVSDTTNNSIKKDNAIYISEDEANKHKSVELLTNDIIISSVGSKPPLYDSMVGKVILVPDFENGSLLNQNAIRFRAKIDNQTYLYHYLKQNKYIKFIESIMRGNANQRSITVEDLLNFQLVVPSLKEQIKVGNLLLLLDKKIELQIKKIEALKLFKKGLFDTQLKTNEKELIMFDDFLDEATEKSSIQNQYPVLSSTSKGLFLQSDYFKKQASSENNVGYKILKRNQLVLSPQNLWMGNININNIFDIGIVSPSYRVYNIDIKKIDLNYFNYWIKTPKALYSYLISSEQGASIVRRNLNIEMFNQISLKIPDLEKQHIIGNRIYQFYLKINLEEEKLKLLYKLKKGLMQNMFI